MKYKILENFKIKVSGKTQEFVAGMVIELELEKAKHLVERGKINAVYEPVIDNSAVKIFSRKLNKELWLAKDEKTQHKLIDNGIEEPVFTHVDIQNMGDQLSDEALQRVYDFKNVFRCLRIDRVKGYGNNTVNH